MVHGLEIVALTKRQETELEVVENDMVFVWKDEYKQD